MTGVEVKVGTKVLVGVSVAAGFGTSISRTEQPKSIEAASAMVRVTRHFLAISLLSIPYFSNYRQVLGTAQVGIRASALARVPILRLPRLQPCAAPYGLLCEDRSAREGWWMPSSGCGGPGFPLPGEKALAIDADGGETKDAHHQSL